MTGNDDEREHALIAISGHPPRRGLVIGRAPDGRIMIDSEGDHLIGHPADQAGRPVAGEPEESDDPADPARGVRTAAAAEIAAALRSPDASWDQLTPGEAEVIMGGRGSEIPLDRLVVLLVLLGRSVEFGVVRARPGMPATARVRIRRA